MGQVTWRAPEALIERVQHLAAAEGVSMNAFLSRVLTLATESDESDPLVLRLRNRLRAAGMLAEGAPTGPRPSKTDFARARAAAGEGIALSDVVTGLRE
ncbi:transcriptional regulator [Cryobacterium algoritolerans]|uniref:Transcriptional regulator n=1 Tax=Cryobacterium algoritolerans TaxID=1259184 RepID=A0A4R8WWR4_9MICO|nr:transcriptional regulator [Cryobacterium algoritolerans]TFC17385.1 transcriptional regulator [Cryobacterium algoritolerans]